MRLGAPWLYWRITCPEGSTILVDLWSLCGLAIIHTPGLPLPLASSLTFKELLPFASRRGASLARCWLAASFGRLLRPVSMSRSALARCWLVSFEAWVAYNDMGPSLRLRYPTCTLRLPFARKKKKGSSSIARFVNIYECDRTSFIRIIIYW